MPPTHYPSPESAFEPLCGIEFDHATTFTMHEENVTCEACKSLLKESSFLRKSSVPATREEKFGAMVRIVAKPGSIPKEVWIDGAQVAANSLLSAQIRCEPMQPVKLVIEVLVNSVIMEEPK